MQNKKNFSRNFYFRILFILVFYLGAGNNFVSSQQFKFNHYSAVNGLTHQYIYSIAQNSSGYLWLGTSTGIVRFDGDGFQVFTEKEGLAEAFTTTLFVAANGQMWAGHNQGGVSMFDGDKFKKVITSKAGFGNIVGLGQNKSGGIVAVGQTGKILVYNKGVDQIYDFSSDEYLVSAMAITQGGIMLLGTDVGMYSFKFKNFEPILGSKKKLASLPEDKVQCITKSERNTNVLWVATASGQIFKLTDRNESQMETQEISTGATTLSNIQNVFEDVNGYLWVSTYAGVFKFSPSKDNISYTLEISYNQTNGLPSDQVKCVFQDNDKNTWFGLYGSGLAMLKDEFFTFYQYKTTTVSNNIQSLLISGERKYFGSDIGLGCVNCILNDKSDITPYEKGLENQSVTVLKNYKEGILAGTAKGGLFWFNPAGKIWKKVFYSKTDNLANAITDLEVTEKGIWLGTRGGLYELSDKYETLHLYNTENGMAHNSINDVHLDRTGKLWVSSQSNMVATIKNGKVELIQVTGPSQSINITCITEDNTGNIWMGTYGNGVFRQKGKEFIQISSINNLASDYCYFIIAGNENDVWVGHRGALSRIDAIKNKIKVFDNADGIESLFNELAAFKDIEGNLWFGSNKGVMKFDPKKFVNTPRQPKINIKRILLSDKQIEVNKSIDLAYGNYRLVISFIGINFNNPQKVKYKYILKGFDLDWSDVVESNQAYYPKLSDGEYEFIVKACNEDGEFGKTAARIKIRVEYPFWKQWWFIILSAIVAIGIVALIIYLRERNQRKLRIYLETELEIRTREVVEQKSLVDQKNKDITDSINYAYKIQSSLLPSLSEIRKHLPQFFVMYKPRDIVSGDFYWCSKKNNIIRIAVADCTGHGVPGAFMSAIGNLIFRKVDEYMDTVDPAKFISHVDEYLLSLMNPSPDSLTHDGMDMVLVMIDISTGEVVFSGAKRPLTHFKNDGTNELYKTNFESIGGLNPTKVFTNTTIQLQKGETIYMYSDGIVDQFGGTARKKIMTRGLIEMLEKSVHMDLVEQGLFLDKSFDDWKGENHQVDDVLVMGIRYTG
jgi:ligand-binding sensor domain-containing protein/serine phosphatase RsbU (regulator of sigma subunit)